MVPRQPTTVQGFDGRGRRNGRVHRECRGSYRRSSSPPPLLDHRCLPLLPRRQDLLLIAADLVLHDLQLRPDEQPHLPPECVGEERRSCLTTVLVEAEEVTDLDWRSVPRGSL
jgi:hypothetical protein